MLFPSSTALGFYHQVLSLNVFQFRFHSAIIISPIEPQAKIGEIPAFFNAEVTMFHGQITNFPGELTIEK